MLPNSKYSLGVIVTNAPVPRVPGEIGNQASADPSTLYEIVSFHDFLSEMITGLLPSSFHDIVRCRDALVRRGAGIVATSCGLLWPYQEQIQKGCPVPVITSSLCLVEHVESKTSQSIAIVTIELGFLPFWSNLYRDRLDRLVFFGLGEQSYLYKAMTGKIPKTDFCAATAEHAVIQAIKAFLETRPDIEALILECTNLSPYKKAIADTFGVAVYDIFSAISILGDENG